MDVFSAPATFPDLALRLVLATVCGAAVGFNHEIHLKPAGIRTHALVGLGAAVVTAVAAVMATSDGLRDASAPSRVLQGVLAGIGFIGGGAILQRVDGWADGKTVQGLATAASIWVVAAIGIAGGGGMWRTAVLTAALTLLILAVGARVNRSLHRRFKRTDVPPD